MAETIVSTRPATGRTTNPELLDAPGHACGFFHSEEEEYEVLLPFIREGLALGERAVHIVEPGKREEHLQRLVEAGIDIEGPLARGQLVVIDWHQTYWKDGPFDQDRTMAQFAASRREGRELGFPRTRFICRMGWALEEGSIQELARYEATADFVPLDGDVAICVYQIPHWGGQLLMTALRTHQFVILGGLLHENPFHQSSAVLASLSTGSAMRPTCC